MTAGVLRFPGERLATIASSFGAADHHSYQVLGTKGSLRVEPAFEVRGRLGLQVTIEGRQRSQEFPRRDQVAPEILYFSECILRNRTPEPSGKEGLADVRVIRALLRSAENGRPVRLGEFVKRDRPDRKQEIRRPPVRQQELVATQAPSRS